MLLFETLHMQPHRFLNKRLTSAKTLSAVTSNFSTLIEIKVRLHYALFPIPNSFTVASLEGTYNTDTVNYCYLQRLQVPSKQHFPYCWSCVFEYHKLYQNHRFLELSPQLPRANCKKTKQTNPNKLKL